MAFEEVDIVKGGASSGKTGVSVGLCKMRSAPALLRITISAEAFAKMEYDLDDRFKLLIGTGEDHGIIRLRKDVGGQARATEKSLRGGLTFYQIALGHRAEFVDRVEKAVQCQWEKVDLGTVEIVLPKWADETGSAKKVSISSVPGHVAAGKREEERLRRERQEAEGRRRANDVASLESEALRQVKQTLASGGPDFRSDLKLTKTEAAMLRILVDRQGKLVSADTFLTLLYLDKPDEAPAGNIVAVYISKIRAKLPVSVQIKTSHGEGFRLTGEVSDLLEKAAA